MALQKEVCKGTYIWDMFRLFSVLGLATFLQLTSKPSVAVKQTCLQVSQRALAGFD